MMPNRKVIVLALLAVSAGIFLAMFAITDNNAVEAQSQSKRAIATDKAPKAVGPYSQAIIANGFVYAAGQIGSDPKTGTLVEGGIAEQTEQALRNIAAVLEASGSGMKDVVKATVFLADMEDFAKMNEIYAKHLGEPFPARSTVQVARLPRDAKIEIEVIAVLKK